ncbi:MAG TPA: sulfatase-like hydrolase/transferase [Casimicrobiaceae bacterium]|nr:sulfatase-like hydrolase/transferase [Casimicrobiaceae bacterium]
MTHAHRPNFVFILADDLGYADVGCYGARADVTPTLDRLAQEGLRFTDGYANSPVCSPTRFALMTGRYQYRIRGGAEEPLSARTRGNPELGLSPAVPTLPGMLRAAGYATALVGKWHLGYPPHFGPRRCGYDEFFGTLGGGIDYFRHCDWHGVHDLYDNESECHREGYVTDLFSERAVDFIERAARADKPFLLSLHYTAPHWPWETRDDRAESHRIGNALYHLDGGSVHAYRTMVRQMDEGIARVVQALAQSGADAHTLIVFTSDNGGERYSDTWPFVGQKMDLLEGGIRVPLIARWPDVIAPGGVTAQLAITMDWVATFLTAAGVAADAGHALDGVDLGPVLREPSALQPRELFWRMKHRDQRALRAGAWKYIAIDGSEFLFDLDHDGRERANLARRHPERFAALRDRYAAWSATMPPIPGDAGVYRVYGKDDLPSPGG